ncbi:MAG TPA: hypothetical protein VGK06_15090 [Methanosarcina sp.]|jgi:hypothetical protein
MLERNPFQKRFDRNLSGGKLNHKPFEKRFDRKPQQCLDLEILSPNPIGVINRRNGCGSTVVLD